jgi:hypothetical protein
MNHHDPYDWLTVPEILTDLQVSPEDWQEWENTGQAPHGVIFPDGHVRISGLAYERWIDAMPTDDSPMTDPDDIRGALRHALKSAGERGLSRDELCDLFGPVLTPHAVDNGLAALLRAGHCTTTYRTTTTGPQVRYRYHHQGTP